MPKPSQNVRHLTYIPVKIVDLAWGGATKIVTARRRRLCYISKLETNADNVEIHFDRYQNPVCHHINAIK